MNTETAIFKCKNEHCRAPLGFSQGSVLMVGAVKIIKFTHFQCAVCGRSTHWTPEKREDVQTRKVA